MTQPQLLGGRYELEGVVGRGGMAEVYRARDLRLDRVVAIKTLRPDLARDQTFQARFRREAQSAASLNHPSIVAVYDTGEDMATGVPVPYIVMEYVDGRTVRDLLMEGQRLLPERVLDITDGILRALEYSHQAGIVHRDIKPCSLMVTRNGDVNVMDFGIARAMNDSQATMTQTAQVIGTAQYLSPEQARGERVDARSDLYSTGCLMYELLVGRPPFTGDSPVAIAYQHVRENPVPPSHVDPALPPWADAIVLRAMAKSPNDRYQSAAEMQADIQRARSGMQVSAPPPTRMDYYGGGYPDPTQRMGAQTMMAPGTQVSPYAGGGYDDFDRGYGGGGGRRHRWVPWLIAAIVLIAAAVVAAMLVSNSHKSAFVPIVQGQTQAAAESALRNAGFVPQVTDQNSDSVSRGRVIKTNPPGGNSAAKGSTVIVYVSEGQAKVTVPTISQCELEGAAQQALTNAHLVPNPVSDPTSTCPQNTVDHINPPAGTQLTPNSTVTMFVAGGGADPQSVVGYPVATAKQILQAQGFTDITTDMVNAPAGGGPMTAGTVWKQIPGTGASVPFGAKITLFVQQTTTSPSPSASPSVTPTSTPTSTPTPSATPTPTP